MSKQLEKINTSDFNRHGNCKIDTATVVHAMGGSILVSKVNDLIEAVQELQVQIADDEVLVNGKRHKLISPPTTDTTLLEGEK